MKFVKSHSNIKNNHLAFLSLGSNINNKLDNINLSLKYLKNDKNIKIIKLSSIYQTEPMYYNNQSNFLNLALKLQTSYKIHDLLNACKLIEKNMGRDFNQKRNYPRIIDLDILTYDNLIYSDDVITIPHPRMHERKFVLIPINEIEPNYIIPGYKVSIKKILNHSKDISKVRKL